MEDIFISIQDGGFDLVPSREYIASIQSDLYEKIRILTEAVGKRSGTFDEFSIDRMVFAQNAIDAIVREGK